MNPELNKNAESIVNRTMEQLVAQFDGDYAQALESFEAYIRQLSRPKIDQRKARMVDSPVILSVEHVSKEYKLGRQKVRALDDVSLQIYQGEIVAITGASGSGKSTLLQLIGGLDKPTRGDIKVSDISLSKLSDKKLSAFRLKTIGFVFQFFYLQPFLSLEQNLEVPGMFLRNKRQDRKKRAEEIASKIGLSDRLHHLPKELSGGQMQRSAIARALFNKPKILLADEPTGNLDSKNSATIIDLFEDIRDTLGTTIIIVTHDHGIASRADRVVTLKDGIII